MLETFPLNYTAHVGRQTFEPIQLIGFGNFTDGLLLIAVAGIAHPKKAGVLGALLFR